MNITIVGGGNSAHILIPMLAAAGHHVSLLTHRPDDWSQTIRAEYHTPDGKLQNVIEGDLTHVSSVHEEVIPCADVLILCMPVAHYREALYEIAPYIDIKRNVIVGVIYGQAGFNWMMDDLKQKFKLPNVSFFAYGLIPWIARTQEYGKVGVTYGCKAVNVVAVSPMNQFEKLNTELFEDICFRWFHAGKVKQAKNFISLTLSVDNQIIHPTRCYGLYTVSPNGWSKQEDAPYFYRDYDDISSDYLRRLDDDYTKIRKGLKVAYPDLDFSYMLDYLALEHLSYQSHSVSIRDSFVNSQTLTEIKTPIREYELNHWELDRGHRFFSDDIGYGICIAKWFAEKLNVVTPMIDELLHWVEKFKGQKFLNDHGCLDLSSPDLSLGFVSGVPFVYGYKTLDDVMNTEYVL